MSKDAYCCRCGSKSELYVYRDEFYCREHCPVPIAMLYGMHCGNCGARHADHCPECRKRQREGLAFNNSDRELLGRLAQVLRQAKHIDCVGGGFAQLNMATHVYIGLEQGLCEILSRK